MDFLWHILAVIAMTLPNVLGYNLIFGKGKVFHFGPLGVSVIATYATFLTLIATGSWITAILVGLLGSCIISVFFAWLSFRLEPDGLGIMTIAVHLALLTIVLNWTGLTRGALGLPKIPRFPLLEEQLPFALVTMVVAAVWFAAIFLLDRSRFGRALAALAENQAFAQALGVDRVRVHLVAFLIGGVGALLSTVLFVQYLRLAHPSDLTFPFLIFFVMAVVAGKPGSVLGVTFSTVLLVLLKEGLRFLPLPTAVLGPVRLLLFGIILLVAVYVRRDTLFPQQRTV